MELQSVIESVLHESCDADRARRVSESDDGAVVAAGHGHCHTGHGGTVDWQSLRVMMGQ